MLLMPLEEEIKQDILSLITNYELNNAGGENIY